jgi:hypothetical protein
MTPFTVDGASYDAEPFSLTGLPLTFQISPDHHLFFQQGWHSATLMSRYPGDFTLTASANVKGLIDPIRTPSSDTVSDTWHIHTPVPPAHITSTPSTHTIIWETADVNFPAYTARLLPEEPISLRYKLTSQLSIQSFMKFFRTPHQEIPDNLAEEDIPLSKFGGGTWTSSDNSVVAVTQDGLLTAHKTGEATISFTTAGPITDYPYPIDPFTITQKVTVPPAVASSLKLAWKSGTVQAQSGDAVTLHTLYYDNQVFPTTLQALFPIDILPEYKDLITPNDYTVVLTWTSSNPEVASVSSTGFVTALSPGITTIKVSAQVTPSELCEPQSSYFVVKVPQLPVLKWEQGEGTEEVMTVHLSKLLPQPVLKTTTIQYAGMSYSLLGMRWTTSDERVVQVRWDANNRSEARLEAIGEGEATITFEADGLPYSGYSEHKEFTLTQRVHVPKLPQRQVKSTLTDVNKTEVEYIPVGASLAFPYKVEYTYEGKAYPLVNEVWTTSNAEVVDVWKSTTGWRLFAQTEGEAILKFHAEGGAYGFETFEFERRVSIVSMLPEGNEETPGGDEEIPGGDEEIPGGDEEIPGEVTGAVSIRWNDDGEDKVMKVGERFKLGLWLIMDGETYPYPNGGAEWLSSNEGVVSVRWGEVEALKTGFATVYAHVKIGERAAVVSRYIAVPRQGSLYEVHDGIVPITSSDDTPQYYTLTGKYIGNQTPEKVGVYLQKIGEAMIKVIVH